MMKVDRPPLTKATILGAVDQHGLTLALEISPPPGIEAADAFVAARVNVESMVSVGADDFELGDHWREYPG